MGWFGNLFKKKKTLEEVKTWLEEEQKKQVDEQGQATDKFRAEFPELLTGIQKAMTALEQAELRNPSIPERAKHYMVGNREQLLKLTTRFIENLAVPKEAPDFSQMDLLFHQYAQNTARPATILSEFLGEEVKEIRKRLADTEAKIHEIKLLQEKKEQLGKIKIKIQRIKEVKQEQKDVEKQREEFNAQLQQLKNKEDTIRKEKEEFNTRPEYLQVKEDLITTAKERQESEQAITGLFLALSDPIKKYAHKLKNQKLAQYAENPVEELIHDYSLSILKHLQGIEEAMEKGELELKPEKVQRAIDALKLATKENLGTMIHRYAKAKKRETDMQSDVAQRPIMHEYDQYAVDLKSISEDIDRLEKTITKLVLPTDEQVKEELKAELEKHGIFLV